MRQVKRAYDGIVLPRVELVPDADAPSWFSGFLFLPFGMGSVDMRWFLSNVCLGIPQTDVGAKCPAHGARRVEQPKGEGKDKEKILLEQKQIAREEYRARASGRKSQCGTRPPWPYGRAGG